jgi:hypothetical protein
VFLQALQDLYKYVSVLAHSDHLCMMQSRKAGKTPPSCLSHAMRLGVVLQTKAVPLPHHGMHMHMHCSAGSTKACGRAATQQAATWRCLQHLSQQVYVAA